MPFSMMTNDNAKCAIIIAALGLPFFASANMIWPSVYIVQQYYSWYVIFAGLIIETIAAIIFLKTNWKKSLIIMTAVNAISAIAGLLLIPLSGIAVEILTVPFGGGTFQLSHWILDYLCAVLANTCVEGLCLKWIFKYPFKPNFLWLFCANLISVIICVFVPLNYN